MPWCVRKCPYCDFNSHASPQSLPEAEYIAALLADLDADLTEDLNWLQNRAISSVFIGGGTPSLFSPEAYQQLFAKQVHLKSQYGLLSPVVVLIAPVNLD